MEIYRLVYVSDTYKTIDYSDSETFENDNFKKHFADLQNLRWVEPDSNNMISDFPFIMGSIPIISEKALSVLNRFIDQSEIDAVPICVDNVKFYFLHFNKPIGNILNEKASKFIKFKNGDIMDIEKYVFVPMKDKVSPIFKISQLDRCVFVTENVAKIIKTNNLVGVVLEKCEQKKLSLFDKIF